MPNSNTVGRKHLIPTGKLCAATGSYTKIKTLRFATTRGCETTKSADNTNKSCKTFILVDCCVSTNQRPEKDLNNYIVLRRTYSAKDRGTKRYVYNSCRALSFCARAHQHGHIVSKTHSTRDQQQVR
jgi:hypothetical protein